MIRRLLTICLLALMAPCALAQDISRAPEAATGRSAKSLAIATRHMVVAAHPLAAEAGREILRAGGTAIDAAIATQLVLGLVEPQSSGLGGGAFLLHWDAKARELKSYDGRETAPAAATPNRFLRDGKPMEFDAAVHSGLSVGVPGVMRAMELAHKAHGKLAWAGLFKPAIALAENGFAVSERLSRLLQSENPDGFAPAARAYFYDAAGNARASGSTLTNPGYAAALKEIAAKGADAFYEGRISEAIASAVESAKGGAGDLTLADLADYEAKEREPVCFAYKERKICSMGPPSSGGLAIAQTLKLIEPFPEIGDPAARTGKAVHLIAEAEKLAYADRNLYIADPDRVSPPGGLLDDEYLAARRALIDPQRAMEKAAAGLPPGLAKRTFGHDASRERAGTSHISIVDDDGNAVSMTTTIEGAFGSHLWAAGFLLNNELTDFSFQPTAGDGAAIANAVAGGKRPRSSMAPVIVFDHDGNLEAVTGSPGGGRIILFVVKTLVAMFDWGMDAQAAAAFPNFGSEGGPIEIEAGSEALLQGVKMQSHGQEAKVQAMTSGTHTIARRNGRLEGGADPRREGMALGD